MKNLIRKLFPFVLIAALVGIALPAQNAFALGPDGTPAPAGTPDPAKINARLERVFFRQQKIVERSSHVDEQISRVETLLGMAKENGKDVSAVETALGAYKTAVTTAKPLQEQSAAIVQEHAGFDASGKVTEAETARQTVRTLADTLKQYRDSVGESAGALREAIQAFRQANPRLQPTATP